MLPASPGGGRPPRPPGTGWLSAPELDEGALLGVCPLGVCTNTAGSFSCSDCERGYRPSALGHTCDVRGPPAVGEKSAD